MSTTPELSFSEAQFTAQVELFEEVEQLHPLPDTAEKLRHFKRDARAIHDFFFREKISTDKPDKEILGLDSPLAIALAGKILEIDGGNVFPDRFENYDYQEPGRQLTFLFPTNARGVFAVQKMSSNSPEGAKRLDERLSRQENRTLAGLCDLSSEAVSKDIHSSTTYLVRVPSEKASDFRRTFRGSAFE